MAKKAHLNNKREKRNTPGKNVIPGQYYLDLKEGKRLVEQRPQLCKPYYAQRYWGAFKEFLDASGVFNRTWYLYKQISDDPSPEELKRKIDEAAYSGNESLRLHLEGCLDDVVKRLSIMKARQGCDTETELYAKAEKEWEVYKQKLKDLVYYAEKAKVPINIQPDTKEFRNVMLSFVLLHEKVRGSCRREYYRKKYVDAAQNSINQTGYSDPISIYVIESEYQKDEKWQEKYLRRKKKQS